MKIASEGGLAVVTGAAGGLGSSFAKQLAERGYHLLLVDRRQQQLEQVSNSITARFHVRAEPYPIDLCKREELERLAKRLQQSEDLEVLVNNAGFGALRYFVDTDPRQVANMADVHVVTPMILTRAALPGMIARNRGAIINVSSVSAWFQSAGNVHYGSTKCFLAMFSLALEQELLGTEVRVQALCPGFVRTEFHDTESMQEFKRTAPSERWWMAPDDVVACSLQSLSGKQVIVTPGLAYRLLGRFAQMPVLRPLMQYFARVPRPSSAAAQVAPAASAEGEPMLASQKIA